MRYYLYLVTSTYAPKIETQNKMTQYILLVSCWVLAVGRGSGLTGLPSQPLAATTPLPHSSRPPPQATRPALDHVQIQNHSLLSHAPLFSLAANITSSVPGVLEQADGTKPTTVTASSTSKSTFTTSTIKTFTAESTIAASTLEPSTIKQSISPRESHKASVTLKPTVNPTKPVIPVPKEYAESVPQHSQKPLFIRRKHKEPINTSRVVNAHTKTSVRSNRTDGLNSESDTHHTKNHSRVSDTVKNAVKVFKSKAKMHRSTRRPELSNTASTDVKHNKAKKTNLAVSRKRPITMGIPASSTVLLTQKTTSTAAPTVEVYGSQESDEYYTSYGDYIDIPVMGYNSSGYREAALLPDPDVARGLGEPETEVVLPDDSLADTDLHDHDKIDSVMYIYFGSSERDERGAGRQVLVVGAVISLVAQILTLVSVLRRLHTHTSESASLILLNAELALTAGNLVFMFGVQATGSKTRCELVAVSLHYLHLATCAWLLVNSVFAYSGLQKTEETRRLRPWWVAAWSVPAAVVLLCVVFNRRGYETRSFCWVSVARGMLYSFMVPIALLILLNTCLAVLGLRQLSLSLKAEDSDRKAMRVSAILLPVFAVVWFLGVVALENSASLVFPLLFVTSSGFLNWFVLACWLPADMSLWRDSDEEYDDDDDDIYEEVLKINPDSQPLLEEPAVYVCGRRELCELQMDPICTISS